MNTKTFLAPALGALLLGGSALALANDRDNRHHGGAEFHGGAQFHGPQHDNRFHADRRWEGHRDHRWSPPAPRVYWRPAPVWHHPYYGGYGYRGNGWGAPAYNSDGVTIILRGRIN